MLSGRPPFLTLRVHEDSATSIMNRIKNGDFKMDDDSWKNVSNVAKAIVKGLLTVDPKRRLRLEDLMRSPWLNHSNPHHQLLSQFNNNPISSLFSQNTKPNVGRIDRQLMQTFNAFHSVAREGGLAQLTSSNVTVAKVIAASSSLPTSSASRRHLKSSTVSSTNSSTSSNGSSAASGKPISISVFAQHAPVVHPFIFQPAFASSQLSTSFLTEAIQGVSSHILPSQVNFAILGQSAYGPMTRLRKRKMAERSGPDDDSQKCYETTSSFLPSVITHHPIIPSVQHHTPFVVDTTYVVDQNKRLKTAEVLSTSPSGYYSVSVTRVPAASGLANPCSRTFQSIRTPTITID